MSVQVSKPNQEPQQTPRQKQRFRMQDDSPTDGVNDLVLLHQVRKRWRQIKCRSLICPTGIEVMTDVQVLLDGSSVIDVFAVSSARRKRVEVSERKLTE